MECAYRRHSRSYVLSMVRRGLIYYLSCIIGYFLIGCTGSEISMINIGVDDIYVVERMKKVIVKPEFDGVYEWSMKDIEGKDSIISGKRDFIFLSARPGEYTVKMRIIDDMNPYECDILFVVWEEQVAYSRYITKVYEYCPAPGQFVNSLPFYETGDTESDMIKKAEESISGTNDILVSLGGYGGYITFGFDHTVVNVEGEYDFKILGNAFYAAANPNPNASESAGSSEPGIVMVSLDVNGNGIADDEWYELAGSEFYKEETQYDYTIKYYRPDIEKTATPQPNSPFIDTTYVRWISNMNEQGYIVKNSFHLQDYYPKWVTNNELTFKGTRLANNYVDKSGNGSFYVQYAYDWGYVDNHPNDIENKSSFKIDWAVDDKGNKVRLPGVDFIRVYTGVNQQCGWLGETSTELSRAEDLHVEDFKNYIPIL